MEILLIYSYKLLVYSYYNKYKVENNKQQRIISHYYSPWIGAYALSKSMFSTFSFFTLYGTYFDLKKPWKFSEMLH
jgi:hypothetical protein